MDAEGNVYISDQQRVGKIQRSTGIISTVAGGGTRPIPPYPMGEDLGDGGPATDAVFIHTGGLAVDSAGNIFVADGGTRRVRRVDRTSGIVTTVAGNGTCGFSADGVRATAAALDIGFGIAVDAVGNLLICETGNHTIRRVDAVTGIALDGHGSLYIADTGNGRVRVVHGPLP